MNRVPEFSGPGKLKLTNRVNRSRRIVFSQVSSDDVGRQLPLGERSTCQHNEVLHERLNATRDKIIKYCLACEVERELEEALVAYRRSLQRKEPERNAPRSKGVWGSVPFFLLGTAIMGINGLLFVYPIVILVGRWALQRDLARSSTLIICWLATGLLFSLGFLYGERNEVSETLRISEIPKAPPTLEEVRTRLLSRAMQENNVVEEFKREHKERWLEENARMDDLDNMSGIQFEEFIEAFFRKRGYQARRTPDSGDMGADVLLTNTGTSIAVQCKRYSERTPVGVSAVQEVVAAMHYYRSHQAMVITTSWLTTAAKRMARSIGVEVWERRRLQQELSEQLGSITWEEYLSTKYES